MRALYKVTERSRVPVSQADYLEHLFGYFDSIQPRWKVLDRVDWNAELVRGDLGRAVQQLKQESGKGLLVGGVKLPLALAELGLIDEYEFVVQPRLAGYGPTLFAGLSKGVDLKLVSRLEFGSGAVAMRYEPRR
jgi:dihydrofolate reductase